MSDPKSVLPEIRKSVDLALQEGGEENYSNLVQRLSGQAIQFALYGDTGVLA